MQGRPVDFTDRQREGQYWEKRISVHHFDHKQRYLLSRVQYKRETRFLQLFVNHTHHHVICAAFFHDPTLCIFFPVVPCNLEVYMMNTNTTPAVLYETLRTSFGQLASGLAHIHAMHVVHNDLKPENVLITHDGELIITDFGSASYMYNADTQQEHLQNSRGDERYMAPEDNAQGYPRDVLAMAIVFIRIMNARLGKSNTAFQQRYCPNRRVLLEECVRWAELLRAHSNASEEDRMMLVIAQQGLKEQPLERPYAWTVLECIQETAPTYVGQCCTDL